MYKTLKNLIHLNQILDIMGAFFPFFFIYDLPKRDISSSYNEQLQGYITIGLVAQKGQLID